MTNYEFLINSDKDTVAEILTSIALSIFDQMGMTIDDYSLCLKEKAAFKLWLDTEIVAGDYVN